MLTWNDLDIFFLQITYTFFRTFCSLKKLEIVLLKVWSARSVFKEAEEVFKATISDRQRSTSRLLSMSSLESTEECGAARLWQEVKGTGCVESPSVGQRIIHSEWGKVVLCPGLLSAGSGSTGGPSPLYT